ncbi:PLP-dependent aminotransferase family protein [[Enterobacter] lignolyticus]|uniref:Transcriptional regulator, GntR family with aminotransferase domain n=1 Tax=Enterobacter lignolyticus (strain SCF1) TaxID=701347 RepID=E3G6B9_ENTLS|nr:PLP-dependent aminotransferase family protein [[Enterobacter] lignolyticus]ADO49578.1 transcriptional regulator, GntR family with aminotransferase domain [[Enterobacter] lignolyticus SCF1]
MNIPDDAFYGLLTRALQRRGGQTLQRTLYHALRGAMLDGSLQAHSRLPGSRAIALRLRVSRNTINAALEQLATEGYLLRDRLGSRVAQLPAAADVAPPPAEKIVLPARLQQLPPGPRRDSPALAFTPGTPAVNYFPLPLWRRLLDRVLREEGSALLGYGDSAGEWPLRAAIARHLALSRGIHCDAGQVVITEGALEGLNLCTHLLSEAGDVAWLEDPGYFGARSAFLTAGLRIKTMAIDDEGMAFPGDAPEIPRLIFTSPSHQYPTGKLLSASRRLALLTFASEQGAWIIEDDYDSEFRYSSEPIPAMLGMVKNAPVVYLGTFSKTLFPSLRIGFMVMPQALAVAAQPAIRALLRGGHRTEQRALAWFIEEGHYARHLAAMRRLYRRRQAQLCDALAQELAVPHRIHGGEGGLHLMVEIAGIDDVQVAERARQYQLAPAALSRFYLNPQSGKTGLVLGYGNTSASQFAPAVRALNRIITPPRRGQG